MLVASLDLECETGFIAARILSKELKYLEFLEMTAWSEYPKQEEQQMFEEVIISWLQYLFIVVSSLH